MGQQALEAWRLPPFPASAGGERIGAWREICCRFAIAGVQSGKLREAGMQSLAAGHGEPNAAAWFDTVVMRLCTRMLREIQEAGSTRRMKTIYHAAHLFEAQLMVHLLGFEGIEARIEGAYLTGALGEIPMGGMVRVCVADEDAGRAEAFVAAHDAARPGTGDTGEDADQA